MQANPVIALAGGIGAGKTAVAKELTLRLNCRRASFGDYVRVVATQRGLAPEREVLQDIGEQFVRADVEGFVWAVLAHSGWKPGDHLVVDGIRHIEAMKALRQVTSPQQAVLVFLEVNDDVRHSRAIYRDRTSEVDLARADAHSTEAQRGTLIAGVADLLVDGAVPIVAVVDEIIAFVNSGGATLG